MRTAGSAGGHRTTAPSHRWGWPLTPRPAVIRRFDAPRSRYGRGHRGVDLAAEAGQPVLAVQAGRVTHVGMIAGRGTISVLHASGIRSTYEPVAPSVSLGALVAQGQPIGTMAANPGHCAPRTCLHLGAVRGALYLDPLPLLSGRVILLPLQSPS